MSVGSLRSPAQTEERWPIEFVIDPEGRVYVDRATEEVLPVLVALAPGDPEVQAIVEATHDRG